MKERVVVYVLILAFITFQFIFYLRLPGFDGETALVRSTYRSGTLLYVELAQSIVPRLQYRLAEKSETRFPPGFPLILAAFSLVTGFSFSPLVKLMIVFTGLGFIVSYEVLRTEMERLSAALVLLLILSSPLIFDFATRDVMPEAPYFLFSFLVLYASPQLELAKKRWTKAAISLLIGFALVTSLMIRSTGLALLAGLFLWLATSLITDRKTALARIRIFSPALILGVLAQILWEYRGYLTRVYEWPLNGYPGSYLTEVFLQKGNYPELGNGSLNDIVSRLGHNLTGYALGLAAIVTRKIYIAPFWFSPAVVLPIAFIGLGVISRILQKRNGLAEWYFIAYMLMFLLWPWDYQIRFLFPVLPLAFLYVWCGVMELLRLWSEKPRILGVVIFPICVLLSVSSAIEASRTPGLQLKVMCIFWLTLALRAIFMSWNGFSRLVDRRSKWQGLFRGKTSTDLFQPRSWPALLVIFPVVAAGILIQVQEARGNLQGEYMTYGTTDAEAARYVDLHTAKSAIVMARHTDLIYYYTKRHVVWFPPISDAHVLMDGIRKHKVEFIIVVERDLSAWLPGEYECFQGLLTKYPDAFNLVYSGPKFKVFEVPNQESGANHS
jgi:hypothetical protein